MAGGLMVGCAVRETVGATQSLPTRGTHEEEIRWGDGCMVVSIWGVPEW